MHASATTIMARPSFSEKYIFCRRSLSLYCPADSLCQVFPIVLFSYCSCFYLMIFDLLLAATSHSLPASALRQVFYRIPVFTDGTWFRLPIRLSIGSSLCENSDTPPSFYRPDSVNPWIWRYLFGIYLHSVESIPLYNYIRIRIQLSLRQSGGWNAT